MSAYALPGLFPPIDTAEPEACGSTSVDETDSKKIPLHQSDRSTLSDIFKASVDRLRSPLRSSSLENTEKDLQRKPGIQVKDAKIDHVLLVQNVTKSPKSPKQVKKRLSSIERPSDSPQSPNARKDQALGTPHDEAITFELSISFHGRKYTATRTMQCIIQLRDDLIREMNNKKRWLKIPEIPPLNGDENESSFASGFVGRGFTMLHAMVTSYVPVMERWLASVMAVVPQDSECLMNFLWEPLPSEVPLDFALKSSASAATLGSIKELDYDTGDSDSEDDWQG